mmetsp:Transcript_42212/g.97951  ORF Transcript_42212/g.97951 Transcript_42212/m.97951 type:complete len:176 (+) Transcript_42212:1148-1675(+)
MPNVDEAKILQISRFATLIFAVCAYCFTLGDESISDFVNISSVWLMVGLFWPLTFGLFWRGATEVGAGLSMFVGLVTYTTLFLVAQKDANGDGSGWQMYEIDTSLWALFIALVAFLFGSLMPQRWQDGINLAMEKLLGWMTIFQNREGQIIKVDQMETEATAKASASLTLGVAHA